MDPAIVRNAKASRYETTVDGATCVLDYRLAEGVLSIDHVGVPPPVEGRGIAGKLVQAALDDARKEGWRVVPHCAYAAAWLRRHPDYASLVLG
jgi:predicted GNAT family acetyltransferase